VPKCRWQLFAIQKRYHRALLLKKFSEDKNNWDHISVNSSQQSLFDRVPLRLTGFGIAARNLTDYLTEAESGWRRFVMESSSTRWAIEDLCSDGRTERENTRSSAFLAAVCQIAFAIPFNWKTNLSLQKIAPVTTFIGTVVVQMQLVEALSIIPGYDGWQNRLQFDIHLLSGNAFALETSGRRSSSNDGCCRSSVRFNTVIDTSRTLV